MNETLQGALATRQAITLNALRLFGEYGYDAVSTRNIADMSNANIGSIAYHFGGKPGLMLACAKYAITVIVEHCGNNILDPMPDNMSAEDARQELLNSVPAFVNPISNRPDAEEIHAFVLRYIQYNGDAFDLMYSEFVLPVQQRICQLLSRATGLDPDGERVRLLAFTVIGQGNYFRICRVVVKRNMEWNSVGDRERELLISTIQNSISALIDALILEEK